MPKAGRPRRWSTTRRPAAGWPPCIAHVLLEADGIDIGFDGHVTDPHFYPLLSTIPGVTGETLDLLELPA